MQVRPSAAGESRRAARWARLWELATATWAGSPRRRARSPREAAKPVLAVEQRVDAGGVEQHRCLAQERAGGGRAQRCARRERQRDVAQRVARGLLERPRHHADPQPAAQRARVGDAVPAMDAVSRGLGRDREDLSARPRRRGHHQRVSAPLRMGAQLRGERQVGQQQARRARRPVRTVRLRDQRPAARSPRFAASGRCGGGRRGLRSRGLPAAPGRRHTAPC